MHHNTASVNLVALLVQYLQGNSNQFGSGFFVLMRIELMFKIANKKIACKRYIIGTCKKEKNIENIVLEKLRFSGALFFFLRLIK